MYDCGILATRLLNKLRCTLILQVSGLIGNIFAFFMFNGQVVASRPLAKVLTTSGCQHVNLDNDVSGVHLHLCSNNSRHCPSCHHTQWRCSHGIAQVYKEYCDVDDDDTYIYVTKKLANLFLVLHVCK